MWLPIYYTPNFIYVTISVITKNGGFMFNIFKTKEVENRRLYDKDDSDLYCTVESACESRIWAFSRNDDVQNVSLILENLNNAQHIVRAEYDEDINAIIVLTDYSGIEESLTLSLIEVSDEIRNFITASATIEGALQGVDNQTFNQALETQYGLVAIMDFAKDNPQASYKAQIYVLSVATKVSILFDESSRKLLLYTFIDFILNADIRYYLKNIYSIVALDNGWTYTIGLKRFYKKDFEVHNVTVDSGVVTAIEFEVIKQFELGTVASDRTCMISDNIYVTYLDIDDATKYLSSKILQTPQFRGESFMSGYQSLLFTDKLNFELSLIEKSLINKHLDISSVILVPTEVTENIKMAVSNSAEYFKKHVLATKLHHVVFIKFGLRTDDNIEFIWGTIEKATGLELTVKLLNKPLYTDELNIDSLITTNYSEVVDWQTVGDFPIKVTPYNLYILENPKYTNAIEEMLQSIE